MTIEKAERILLNITDKRTAEAARIIVTDANSNALTVRMVGAYLHGVESLSSEDISVLRDMVGQV